MLSVVSLIGISAGAINVASSAPQILQNIKQPLKAAHQSPLRNAMQMCGNILWLTYGLLLDAPVLIVFSTFGAGLAFILLLQVLNARIKFG
ncbi:cystinosin/ERS1p repeat containing protein [Ahrensia sp. R2A130]|uniref:cystinosin/ERS1p repeat containing protein n=1 Tax=Ahrensia sp. R2A130 TaxID=744979 RepID=UPI0001E0ACD7|nr:cystinosin/ERS1p repeat containing protein [Ahrensia sp. R2A130]EFL88456.1 putative cystinosin/ERS1p repeat containing protein [Ahrensia sp. R2A130]